MKKYVPGIGPRDAKIVIVGEAPGANEEKSGVPFIGYSGQLLRESLLKNGVNPDHCFITNTCKYRPPGNDIMKFIKKKKGELIPNAEVITGISELYSDLAEIEPNVIVPLGNIALWSLTGFTAITKRRGSIYEVQPNTALFKHMLAAIGDGFLDSFARIQGCKVIPTVHPAAVQRDYSLKPIFELDLGRIAKESAHPRVDLPQRTYYLDPDEHIAHRLASELLASDQISIDIETVGQQLYCVGFSCDPKWALVLRVDAVWKMGLIRQLCGSNIPKTFQNGLFDVPFFLKEEGIVVSNYAYDTMFAQHCAYPEFKKGLDFQASIYTREPYYKDEGKDWNPRDASDVERFLTYNGKDVCVTLEIAKEQQADELQDPGVRSEFEHIMAQTPSIIDMMVNGIRVDTEVLEKLRTESETRRQELQEALDKAVLGDLVERSKKTKDPKRRADIIAFANKVAKGVGTEKGGLNVMASQDVAKYLYEIRGIKPKKNRKSGSVTTAEDALKELYGETGDPIVLTLVSIRKERKLLSSYLNLKVDSAGYTYFSINPVGTKTHRWSVSKNIHGYGFNMQTPPQHIRKIFIPEPGFVFAYLDLSQVEDRIVTYLANVEAKIHAFENGIDVHALTASKIFEKTMEEVLAEHKEWGQKHQKPGPMRFLGKQSNHAFNYEEGPIQFYMSINKKADETGVRITRKQAFMIRERHLTTYPEIEANYWSEIQNQLRRTRTLVNPFGWKRVFHGRLDSNTFRDAYSWIPQSVAPRIVDTGMIEIRNDKTLRKENVRVMLQMHDALLIQMPEDGAEEIVEICKKHMDIPVPIGEREIHIPVDSKFGKSWGDL